MGMLYPLPLNRTDAPADAVLIDWFRRYTWVMTRIALAIVLTGVASMASAAPDPATTFVRHCSSCHTFGRGVLVGPDLKGVTERRDRKWLTAWITSSERVIQSGDGQAVALFSKFNRQRMPDQRLSQAEIAALIDYIAAGGPAQRAERSIDTATAAEIDMGGALFDGRRSFAEGGAPCASCHRIGASDASGGTLGPDLARSYGRYRSRGISALLSRGCFPRVPNASGHAMTAEETFALSAFLRNAAEDRR